MGGQIGALEQVSEKDAYTQVPADEGPNLRDNIFLCDRNLCLLAHRSIYSILAPNLQANVALSKTV